MDKLSRFSTSSRNRSATKSSSLSNGSSSAERVTVVLDDAELADRAEQAAAAIDFPRLDNPSGAESLKQWRSKKRTSEGFKVFSRRPESSKVKLNEGDSDDPNAHVVSVGEMLCSLRELKYIFSPAQDADHNTISRQFYKKDYIFGSVVHTIDGDEPDYEDPLAGPSLVVKTGAFVHSSFFNPNEQWCYVERLEISPTHDAFTVTLASLDESDLAVGKMKAGHVSAISKVTAGYLVERIPSSPLVRVTFSGRSDAFPTSKFDRKSAKIAEAHLHRMAKAVNRLPAIVRTRRLGMQVLANRSAFDSKNSHCTCCTKSLHLLSLKKRCHLCGYNVCDDCWSIHEVETRQGQVATVRICRRCLEFIDKGDYSQVNQRKGSAPRILPDTRNAEPSGRVLTRLLHDALHSSSSDAHRKSVISLIKHLVSQDGNETLPTQRITEEGTELDNDLKQCDEMLESIEREKSLSVDACELANADQRNYALRLPDDASKPSEAPIPADEAKRLEDIERNRLLSLTDTDELDIICTLIAREMNCSTGLVTLINQDEQKVLASNVEPLRKISMPRNHSFCQHTVMDRKPLLVPHPEADVRFQNLPPLHAMDLRFYFGFPLFGENDSVVGSVCCLDTQSHEVTQAQYSAMQRLATTASKIVRVKGRAAVAGSAPKPIPVL